MSNMKRLERSVARLPEAVRVDVEEWGDHPTSRVNGKNFVFCDATAEHLSLKLPKEEADAGGPRRLARLVIDEDAAG